MQAFYTAFRSEMTQQLGLLTRSNFLLLTHDAQAPDRHGNATSVGLDPSTWRGADCCCYQQEHDDDGVTRDPPSSKFRRTTMKPHATACNVPKVDAPASPMNCDATNMPNLGARIFWRGSPGGSIASGT